MTMTYLPSKEIYFNTVPHYIKEDFYDASKPLNTPEFNLINHLRVVANKFGYVQVTADQLRGDVFSNRIKRCRVNDLLLSIRNQQYIWYADRKGNGGTFIIQNNYWLVAEGIWYVVDDSAWHKNGGSGLCRQLPKKEDVMELKNQKRMFREGNQIDSKGYFEQKADAENGSSYTDNDTNKIYDRTNKKKTKTKDFIPNSSIDDQLQRIAKEIGEEHMGFVFFIYGKHGEDGILIMDKIARDLRDKQGIKNKGAYFNSEVIRELQTDIAIPVEKGRM